MRRALSYKCKEQIAPVVAVDMYRGNLKAEIKQMVIGVKNKSLSKLMELAIKQKNVKKKSNRKIKLRRSRLLLLPLPKGKRMKKYSMFKLRRLLGRIKPWKISQRWKRSMRRGRIQSIHLMRISKTSSKLCLNTKLEVFASKWPNQKGRTDDPNYCPYHQMISHPLKECFILKEKINDMLRKGVIQFDKNYDPIPEIWFHLGRSHLPTLSHLRPKWWNFGS